MKEPIQADQILKQLAKKTDRKRISIYASESIYEAFRKACGEEVSPSQVLEHLMEKFAQSRRGSKV